MIEKVIALIAQTPAARPSTPSERLTTFITATRPATVSGPPASPKLDRADERQRDVGDLDARRDGDAGRDDLAGELGAGREVEAVVEGADERDDDRAGQDRPSAGPTWRRRSPGTGPSSRSTPPSIASPPSSGVDPAPSPRSLGLVDRADAPRQPRRQRRQQRRDDEGSQEGVDRVGLGHRPRSLRPAAAGLHRSGLRREVLVERIAVGDRGHALGQLGLAAPRSRGASAVAMIRPTSWKSSTCRPRVASALAPTRRPLVTIGGRGSKGTALRLTVMPISCRRSSACWPSSSDSRRSTRTRCTSVPPVRTLTPAPAAEQLLGQRLGAGHRALLALAEEPRSGRCGRPPPCRR